MPRPGRPGRIHRLPQRLDYTLIPPPLDLDLPSISEKSALPAIIVTPSSPKTQRDFSIAFLSPQAKPTVQERVSSYFTPSAPRVALDDDDEKADSKPRINFKARTMILLLFLFFVLISHVIAHRLATRLPRLDFNAPAHHESNMTFSNATTRDMTDSRSSGLSDLWPRFQAFWGVAGNGVKREFVVIEGLV